MKTHNACLSIVTPTLSQIASVTGRIRTGDDMLCTIHICAYISGPLLGHRRYILLIIDVRGHIVVMSILKHIAFATICKMANVIGQQFRVG